MRHKNNQQFASLATVLKIETPKILPAHYATHYPPLTQEEIRRRLKIEPRSFVKSIP